MMNNERHISIKIENLSVRRGGVQILDNVNASIMCNEITAIIGPNGAGKTTLLLAIMDLIPYTGTISFCKECSHGNSRPKIGYVPQRLDVDRGMPITVLEFLSLRDQKLPLWLGKSKKVRENIITSLERVSASHLINRPLGKLSGGELQRVLLAMALQNEPDIVLLDEPVAGIDVAGEELFTEILSNLQKSSKFTLVLISHDLSVVTKYANHVICMNKTVKCEGRTVEVLTPENLTAIYGINVGLYEHKPDKCIIEGE
ncbi:TPA: metal ABC transporter ATP-binding protein [Candidatus Poribacteria bacterium]|nr:metal ABC transporter ATP-binding protein [Candidatus Poribacteria bacterium]